MFKSGGSYLYQDIKRACLVRVTNRCVLPSKVTPIRLLNSTAKIYIYRINDFFFFSVSEYWQARARAR